ncbi:DUF3717 domain-containing protein [Achromobacter ruhlandii]|uniref:DUF3717 domain-containing protein n=1 Tax=Achromobacter ruhlandii TaxID=72557 RepID=UPI003BA2D659
MRSAYSIAEVELAINHWRQDQPGADAFTLPKCAAILADCYGNMIYKRQVTVASSALSEAQRSALDLALGQWESEKK